MNRFETAQMLSYVSEIDGRRVTDEAVNVWIDLLGGFEFGEVREAVIKHSTESTEFLKPAHVVKLVKTARRERLNKITRIELAEVDDLRGPESSRGAFEKYRQVRKQVMDAIGTGRMTRAQYQEYLHGDVPWSEFQPMMTNQLED